MEARTAAPSAEASVTLRSSEGHEFVVSTAIAGNSTTIKNMIDDGCSDGVIPLPIVRGGVLAKVVEYWKRPGDAAAGDFFKGLDKDLLLEIVMAANYLDAAALLDSACGEVASRIEDLKVEECREFFGIENDWTPEEEAAIRAEHPWVYED